MSEQPGARSARIGSLLRLGKIPGQPTVDVLQDFLPVALHGHEVAEGIDSIELTGVDQAHVEVAHPGTVERLVGHRIPPVQNGHLERTF